MANTYKIIINNADVKSSLGEMTDVVWNVYYSYYAFDENSNSAFYTGVVELPEPDPSSFTSFEELTQSVVISWIDGFINHDQIKSIVDALLEEKLNPSVVSRPIPLDLEDLAIDSSESTATEETTEETV